MRRSMVIGVSALAVVLVAAAVLYAVKPKTATETPGETRYEFILKNLMSGGPPKDGIPAVDKPIFITAAEAQLSDDTVVFGTTAGEMTVAFPRAILYWHEIVNYSAQGEPLSLTYCPLTGTAIGFRGFDLGVTGQLFNNNLVMYERRTDSLIPQMYGLGIDGELKGVSLDTFPVVTTTWGLWKGANPDTVVLTRQTGHFRDYDRKPYPGYEDMLRIWFPVTAQSDELPSKEVVLGIVSGNEAVAVVVRDFAARHPDGLELVLGGRPVNLYYDRPTETVRVKEDVKFFAAFWFAWYAFYPNTKLVR